MEELEKRAFEFKAEVVDPNVEAFRVNPGSLRHAFNAIMAVDALAAYVWAWSKTATPLRIPKCNDDSDYREYLSNEYASFRIFGDLAKAQKHFVLTRGRKPPIIKSADEVYLLSVPALHVLT